MTHGDAEDTAKIWHTLEVPLTADAGDPVDAVLSLHRRQTDFPDIDRGGDVEAVRDPILEPEEDGLIRDGEPAVREEHEVIAGIGHMVIIDRRILAGEGVDGPPEIP